MTQDENKKVVKIAYYDRDHLWKRTDYYSPRLRQQPMEILEPGENGVLLLRELKAGRYDDARALYPCKVPKSPEAESFLSNQVPVPELTVRSQSGDFITVNRSWPRNGRPCWRNIREAEERPRKLCSRRKQADRTPSRNLRMRTGRTGREASLSLLRSLTRKSRRTFLRMGRRGFGVENTGRAGTVFRRQIYREIRISLPRA